jgi:hypothetical protein
MDDRLHEKDEEIRYLRQQVRGSVGMYLACKTIH